MREYYKYYISIINKDAQRVHEQRGKGTMDAKACLSRAFAALAQLVRSGDWNAMIIIKSRKTDNAIISTGIINLLENSKLEVPVNGGIF